MIEEMGDFSFPGLFVTGGPRTTEDKARGQVVLLSLGARTRRAEFEATAQRDGQLLVIAAHLAIARLTRLPGGLEDLRARTAPSGGLRRGTRPCRRAKRLSSLALPRVAQRPHRRATRDFRRDGGDALGAGSTPSRAQTREQAVAQAVLHNLIEP